MATTGDQIVGMGYAYSATQSNGEFRISRHPDVDKDWYAQFLFGDDIQTISVDHHDEDEYFVDIDQFNVPTGQYDWSLELYPSLDAMEQRRGSRIISLSGRDELVIE